VLLAAENIRNLYVQVEHLPIAYDVTSEGIVFMLSYSDEGKYYLHRMNCKEDKMIELTDEYEGIHYLSANNQLILYNRSRQCLEMWDTQLTYEKDFLKGFSCFEIKEFIEEGDFLYFLCVIDNPYESETGIVFDEESGYMDFGETIYKTSLSGENMEKVSSHGVISMFQTQNGKTYFYTYQKGNYWIEEYDWSQQKTTEKYKANDLGYTYAFAVIGDSLIFNGLNFDGVVKTDMKQSQILNALPGLSMVKQSDFQVVDSCVILVDREKRAVYSYDILNGHRGGEGIDNQGGFVLACANMYSLNYSVQSFDNLSGFHTTLYECPESMDQIDFYDNILVKMMAGDSDVDIIYFPSAQNLYEKLSTDRVCMPLDSVSEIKTDYEKYWGYIQSALKTTEGHIWGIPILCAGNVLLYHPNRMEKEGYSPDDLSLFSTFYDMLEKMHDRGSDYIIDSNNMGYSLIRSYSLNYQDTHYEDECFKEGFAKMWGDWKRWELTEDQEMTKHPLMKVASWNEAGVDREFQRADLLFRLSGMTEIWNKIDQLKGFRAVRIPTYSNEEKNIVSLGVMVVNPNGKNKEKALQYLGALIDYLEETNVRGFIYKNIDDYSDSFDVDNQLFQDLYFIAADSVLADKGLYDDIYLDCVEEFQNGAVSIDELVKEINRKVDMMKNE